MRFLEAYTAMRFTEKKICRPGTGVFYVWMPEMVVPADKVNARTRKFLPPEVTDLKVWGYVASFNGEVWQPGAQFTSADRHSDDWEVAP